MDVDELRLSLVDEDREKDEEEEGESKQLNASGGGGGGGAIWRRIEEGADLANSILDRISTFARAHMDVMDGRMGVWKDDRVCEHA